MLRAVISKHACRSAIGIGFALINAAMFLHPMSPEDFLTQLLADPFVLLFDIPGGLMTVVFMAGFAIFLAGAIGMASRWIRLQRIAHGAVAPWGAPIH